jgi:hypothetical protein
MQRNLESVSKMIRIFNPMIWRWEAQHQVKITVNTTTIKDQCEITVEGRDSQNQLIHNEFQSFLGWLKDCAVFRHPNSGKDFYQNNFHLTSLLFQVFHHKF